MLHEVEAPALLWLFPGVRHGYRPSTRWQQSWILFGGSAAGALTTLGYLDAAHPVRRYADSREVERAFAKVLRVTRAGGRSTDVQAVAAIFELIGAATRDESAGDLVERLQGLACRPLSIQQYAEALGLSVHDLRESVRSAAGVTPQEVILTTRLNTAKALLAESDLPVAAIAREVGYEDPAYFSRLFAARAGQPPRAFRRIGSLAGRKSSFRGGVRPRSESIG